MSVGTSVALNRGYKKVSSAAVNVRLERVVIGLI